MNGVPQRLTAGSVSRCLKRGRLELRKNGWFFCICLLFFGGVLVGALSGRGAGEDFLRRMDLLFRTNFELRCSQGMLSAFAASFASSAILLGMVFLLGLSLWGGLPAMLVPCCKGYGYGLSVGYLYGAYGWKGIGYNLLVILPGMFLASVVLAAAALFAFRHALQMLQGYRREAIRDDPRRQLRSYLLKMLWCLLLTMAASLLDMLCALCFSWIFRFS